MYMYITLFKGKILEPILKYSTYMYLVSYCFHHLLQCVLPNLYQERTGW